MMSERHCLVVRQSVLAVILTVTAVMATLAAGLPAGAQTTTTTVAPVTTTTTAPPATTTTVPSTTTTTAGPTATTAGGSGSTNADTDEGSDSGLPWVPILVGVALLALVVVAVALLARRRGARRQAVADWRHHAADNIAEAGATARLLSTGTPPSGQIAQQLVASLGVFEELIESAPDDHMADDVERARRNLQMLGLAIDADYRLRRQPSPDPAQLAQSQDAVRNAAAEADRTLRSVYRGFTAS